MIIPTNPEYEGRDVMTDAAIEVRGLTKKYVTRSKTVSAVNGLDLEVRVGECFGLLGPNGAGKTTTIEILEGLNEPTSGEVRILGMNWATDEMAIRQRIGVTLQETRFPEKATALELAQMFRSFFREGQTPEAVLGRVALMGKANSYVEQLSGGQRQRLAVALALMGNPELLFLDEPTTGLDPQSRRQLWEVINDLRKQGRTVVLTTHYMDEAERLCDRIAIVDHGKVIALGSPSALIAQLGGEHVLEFSVAAGHADIPVEELAPLPSVTAVRREADGYSLTVGEPHIALPALLDHLKARGSTIERLSTRHVSLEDVFVVLTGRHLRDDDGEAETEVETAENQPPAASKHSS